jgi:hypothetical protein
MLVPEIASLKLFLPVLPAAYRPVRFSRSREKAQCSRARSTISEMWRFQLLRSNVSIGNLVSTESRRASALQLHQKLGHSAKILGRFR